MKKNPQLSFELKVTDFKKTPSFYPNSIWPFASDRLEFVKTLWHAIFIDHVLVSMTAILECFLCQSSHEYQGQTGFLTIRITSNRALSSHLFSGVVEPTAEERHPIWINSTQHSSGNSGIPFGSNNMSSHQEMRFWSSNPCGIPTTRTAGATSCDFSWAAETFGRLYEHVCNVWSQAEHS